MANDAQTFTVKLGEIQPSQLFINSAKLEWVMEHPDDLEPIPVKRLGAQVIFTDGHTRALAAHLAGFTEVEACWDEDEWDWDAYRICVEWCHEEGIRTIADLENRVLPPDEYEVLWIERCQEMQQGLEAQRK